MRRIRTTTPHPHPTYRPSGVPWLGDVPEHWEMMPNRALMNPRKDVVGACADDFTLLSLTRRGVIPRDVDNAFGKFPSSFDTYQVIEPGDLVFCLFDIDETPRTVGRSRLRGMVTGAYSRFVCPDVDSTEFLYLLYLSLDDGKLLRPLYSGLRKTIPTATFLRAKVALPPLPEQRAIVRYLDYVDLRIRRYVSAKRKLIALLDEEKQAIVNRAVTRGLDPNVRLKPSGVESLGEVPEHWEVIQLGRIGCFSKGSGGTKEDEVPDGVPCVRYGDLYTTHKFFISKPRSYVSPAKAGTYTPIIRGDVLFPTSGETIEEIGKSAVNLLDTQVICGGDTIIFRPTIPMEPRFAGYALDSPAAQTQKSLIGRGITIMHIYSGQLKYLWLPLPPIDEQSAIVEYLDEATASIDAAIARARRQIELVQEYRTRLIADVVTGKLDVREAAAQLPEEDNEEEPIGENGPLADGQPGDLYSIDESVEDSVMEEEVTA